MNCGPALSDTRSQAERMAKCEDCAEVERGMKPTPAMIGAAHDVTMKEAGIILSHELIVKIYEAMEAASAAGLPKEQPTGAKDGERVAPHAQGATAMVKERT